MRDHSTAILRALGSEEMTGRDIAKRCEAAGHWISYAALYTVLRKMCDQGLVRLVREGTDDDGQFRVYAAATPSSTD